MKKRIMSLGLVVFFFLAQTVFIIPVIASDGEFLDQRQADHTMDGNPDEYSGYDVNEVSQLAQSFTPTLPTLTRAELLLFKGSIYPVTVKLSIRSSLNSSDLTSIVSSAIPDWDVAWIEFDFPDLQVVTGNQYYLVLTIVGSYNAMWAVGQNTIYTAGDAWQNQTFTSPVWNILKQTDDDPSTYDFCFETYGFGEGSIDVVYIDDSFDETTPGMGYDHFTRIQAGINAVDSGGTVHVYPGTYVENVMVNKSVQLLGENQDTTIIAPDVNGDAVYVSANSVTISGFTLQTTGFIGYPDPHVGVKLASSYNEIIGNKFSEHNQGSVYVRNASLHHNTIAENVINGTAFGIWLSHSYDNTLRSNTITESSSHLIYYQGIVLESSTNNNLISNSIALFDSAMGIVIGPTGTENILQHNTIIYTGGDKDDDYFWGITLTSASSNTIVENILRSFKMHNGDHGIRLRNSPGCVIQNNEISGTDKGIDTDSIDTDVSYNTLTQCRDAISCFSQSSVMNNSVTDSTNGLNVGGNSNTIKRNSISGSDNAGVTLSDVSSNTVVNNTLSNNEYALFISNSSNNKFYHNNFIQNSENIFNISAYGGVLGTNIWDNGYPDGGNYWSDYTGTDANGDGIGDTLYPIPHSSDQDHYPFMVANGWKKFLLLQAPSTVTENELFQVTVTFKDVPIHQVMVNFSGTTYVTDGNGRAILTAPTVTSDTILLISAYKSGYENAYVSITVMNILPGQPGSLRVSAPSTVREYDQFNITATDSLTGHGIPSVNITFNGTTKKTDSLGKATFIAPLVTVNTQFIIAAYHIDYGFVTTTILVLNTPGGNITNKGWIFGKITDASAESLSDASILVSPKNIGAIADDEGFFSIFISIGTYTVKASKDGYETVTNEGITVKQNEVTEVNFILTAKEPGTNGKNIAYPIDYAIRYGIKQGIVAGQLYVQHHDDGHGNMSTEVITYDTTVIIAMELTTPDTVSFTIDGSNESTGKIFVVRLGPETLRETKNIKVSYDGVSIPWVDFDTLFTSKEENTSNTTATWTNVVATDADGVETVYCLIRTPHYSHHEISIQALIQVVEEIGSGVALIVFITVFCILGVVYLIPFFLVRKNK